MTADKLELQIDHITFNTVPHVKRINYTKQRTTDTVLRNTGLYYNNLAKMFADRDRSSFKVHTIE